MIESPIRSAFFLQKVLFFSSKSAFFAFFFFGKLLCEDCEGQKYSFDSRIQKRLQQRSSGRSRRRVAPLPRVAVTVVFRWWRFGGGSAREEQQLKIETHECARETHGDANSKELVLGVKRNLQCPEVDSTKDTIVVRERSDYHTRSCCPRLE